tara:strand:+ start:568 stop:765 length:198 start_codon:yes stop_codon:yes gene_type:complete
MFAILEPIIFPTTNICSFFFIAFIEVISSGADVPKATIVIPIARSYTPHIFEMPIDPLIKKFDPK